MLNVNETVTSIKPCYKIRYLSLKIWRYAESPYLCNVFFIVLDLRLTKDWLSGIDSLFLCLPHMGRTVNLLQVDRKTVQRTGSR